MVQYENLVVNTEKTLQEICLFIEEEYTPMMITQRSKETSPINNRTGWALQHCEQVIKPISQSSLDSWRFSLSSVQIREIEKITLEKMLENGYKPIINQSNSFVDRFLSKFFLR